MELGAGHFGVFTVDSSGDDGVPAAFRPTVLMERTSIALEKTPGLSKRAIREAVTGNNDTIELALELLVAEGYVEVQPDGQAHRHRVVRSFRKDDDEANRAPVPKPCRNRAPGTVEGPRAPVPLPLGHGARGTPGTGSDETVSVPQEHWSEATTEEQALYDRLHGEAS